MIRSSLAGWVVIVLLAAAAAWTRPRAEPLPVLRYDERPAPYSVRLRAQVEACERRTQALYRERTRR